MGSSTRAALVLSVIALSCAMPSATTTTNESSGISRAPVRDARAIGAGKNHTCVIARRDVRCWGNNAYGQTTVPNTLRNPRQVTAGAYHTCALDDDGVKCWGRSNEGQTRIPALRNPRQVTAGYVFSCALDDDGVKCWGDNLSSQLAVPALRHPRQLASGLYHSCAFDDDGVKCWGNNRSGQSTPPTTLRNPTELVAGGLHTCVIDDDGMKCWGSNEYGQSAVPALRRPRQIGAGNYYTCALDDDGVKCWGDDYQTQLAVPPLHRPSALGIGHAHACAIDEDGVACWGDKALGQTKVPLDLELVGRHACVKDRCVGDNERGQLGAGDDQDRVGALSTAAPVDLGSFAIRQLTVGRGFGCALGADGDVKCWGANTCGQLGLGDTRGRGDQPGEMGDALPTLRFGAPIAKLALGVLHACAASQTGDVFCWGAGTFGQLGNEATDDIGTTGGPERARLPRGKASDLAVGRGHSCAVVDGAVYCFGANDRGQLGSGREGTVGDRPGTMGDALSAVDLGFVTKSIASGERHVCALSIDGRIKCWGANTNGELGLGDARDRGTSAADLGAALPAVDLGRGQVAVELACGTRHCCARTVQNTLKCWGDNADGQLGLGDMATRGNAAGSMGDALPFVMLPPRERVLSLELTAERTCARTESGLRCWGRNRAGELGYGDRAPRGGTQATLPRLLPALGL